ncbi:MAG TPA: transglycosylase domain-containing protein [Burkholderiales bacterium]|nr:transglycosylase domain-containing protein [Burkholderiales bacterium]
MNKGPGTNSPLPGARPVRIGRWLFALLLVIVLGTGAFAAYVAWLWPALPTVDDLKDVRLPQPSVLLASDGSTLATLRQARQEKIGLAQVSPHVLQALIATEDARFYQHHGVDFRRTFSAIFQTLRGIPQGGSTITQQLVRNLFPEEIGRSRNINRKAKEIITALRIERIYSKQQILETYLNTVPFPYNNYGIETAARTYYGKPAADLDALESATLVGMLKGPQYYNPTVHPERVRLRRNIVLRQMLLHHDLTQGDYRDLRQRPMRVGLNLPSEPLGPAPHFTSFVRKWLTDWAERNDHDVYADGLVVQTTIDPRLQALATEAVERQASALQNIADVEWGQSGGGTMSYATESYAQARKRAEPFGYFWKSHGDLLDSFVRESPQYRKMVAKGAGEGIALTRLKNSPEFMQPLKEAKSRLEAGFIAMDPVSGEIKAWVGSRDFERDQYDHVGQAERQPGSTFKPIVYGAALEQGRGPDSVYYDRPVEFRLDDGSIWRPTDMEGATGAAMTLRQGLAQSKNTITAQVMRDVGVPTVVNLARAVGVNQSKLSAVPSLALGTSAVTLLEMASAYSTIARLGEYRPPVFVTRISDRSGNVLAEFNSPTRRAMSADSAATLVDMMRDVVGMGTGWAIRGRFGITADVAGKTGTTQNNTDGWFLLMHPRLVAGAWVGFNDARVTMRSNYWGQGGHNAILLVGDFFRAALKDGLIDGKAQFPRRMRPGVMAAAAPAQVGQEGDDGADQDGIEAPAKQGVVIIEKAAPATTATLAGSARGNPLQAWQHVDVLPHADAETQHD